MLRASAGPEDTRLLDLTSRPLTDEAEVAEALARLRAHPVLEQARAEVIRRAEVARSYLSRLPEGPARDALSALCDQVVSRSS
jgi:heptaprenyl diphosphate synthase